jgi:hypothetical protein
LATGDINLITWSLVNLCFVFQQLKTPVHTPGQAVNLVDLETDPVCTSTSLACRFMLTGLNNKSLSLSIDVIDA